MKIYFFDTVSLIKNAGGVLNVSESLKEKLYEIHDRSSEDFLCVMDLYPFFINFSIKLKLNRFIIESIIYNYISIKSFFLGEHSCYVFPNYFLPFSLLGKFKKCLVVVHDLQFKEMPENFSLVKRYWLDFNLKRLRVNSAKVVFISESCRLKFFEFYGDLKKSKVIFNPVDVDENTALNEVRGERYMVASYHFYPHKNFIAVLKLFKKLKELKIVDKFYITGTGREIVGNLIRDIMGDDASVVHLGLVDRSELMTLYKHTIAFASLSKYEGFNLSAAEAATMGAPLLLSDIPVHRELFDGFAVFISSEEKSLKEVESYLVRNKTDSNEWAFKKYCRPDNIAGKYLDYLREPI